MENKNLSIEEELEIFFQDPAFEAKKDYSTLYLLRRDIYRCLGYTKIYEKQKLIKDEHIPSDLIHAPILWPAAMGILTGIDLLGKSYLGDENNKCVGKRFTEYCKEYMHLNEENAEVIFQFRNALLHSYGLYSKDRKGKTYYFSLIACGKGKDLVTLSPNNNSYMIDLYTLWEKFENSIDKYREDLINDNMLQQKFQKIIKYSIIQIKQVKVKTK